MKRLLLLRHAKSDWDSGAAADHERPLAARGRKSARAMGRFMGLAELEVEGSAFAVADVAAGKCRLKFRHGLRYVTLLYLAKTDHHPTLNLLF